MTHEIFKLLPHQRIVSERDNVEEIFDLYQCGLFSNDNIQENVELVELQPQSKYYPHYHKNSSAIVYIISGTGLLQINNNLLEYKPGVRIIIPASVIHGFKTIARTLFLSIQSPPIINPDNGQIDLYYDRGDGDEKR